MAYFKTKRFFITFAIVCLKLTLYIKNFNSHYEPIILRNHYYLYIITFM